jgi:hypothetical protein
MARLLHVFPDGDAAMAVQPIAQGYLTAARAVAAAVMYRFTGLNTGFGCAAAAAAARGTAAALDQTATPLHFAQVVLAEWLLVHAEIVLRFGAAAAGGSMTTLALPDAWFVQGGVTPCTNPRQLLQNRDELAAVHRGTRVPSLACVLAFVADWCGAVLPAYVRFPFGDVRAAAAVHMPDIQHLRVSAMGDCAASRLLAAALDGGRTLEEVVGALNEVTVPGGRANPHWFRIHICDGDEDSGDGDDDSGGGSSTTSTTTRLTRVAESTARAPGVAPAFDAPTAYPATLAVPVPLTAAFDGSEDELHTLLQGRDVAIVRAPGDSVHPLLPLQLVDAALQTLALAASAQTFAAAIPEGCPAIRAAFVDARARVTHLYAAAAPEVIRAAVQEAFRARFPRLAFAAADPDLAPAPVRAIPDTSDEQPDAADEQPDAVDEQPDADDEQPDAAEAQQPDAAGEEPDAGDEAQPDAGDEAQPDAGDEEQPDAADEARPDTADEQQPAAADEAQPDTADEQQPAAADEEQPDAGDEAQPDAADEQQPDAGDEAQPDAADEQQPDAGDEQPDAADEQQPDAGDEAQPDAAETQPAGEPDAAEVKPTVQPDAGSGASKEAFPGRSSSRGRGLTECVPRAATCIFGAVGGASEGVGEAKGGREYLGSVFAWPPQAPASASRDGESVASISSRFSMASSADGCARASVGRMLTVWAPRQGAGALRRPAECLAAFFARHDLVVDDAAIVFAHGPDSGDDDDSGRRVCAGRWAALFVLEWDAARRCYDVYRADATAAVRTATAQRLGRLRKLCHQPLWSVVLAREDLLWVAATAPEFARAALQTLLKEHHVPGVTGRRVQDAASCALLREVLQAPRGTAPRAARWAPGPVAELLFRVDDAAAMLLVDTLDAALSNSSVAPTIVARDGGSGNRPVFLAERAGVVVGVLRPATGDGDATLVLHTTTDAATVDKAALAFSQPLVRGLCLSRTQAAVASSGVLGTRATRAAVAALLATAAVSEGVPAAVAAASADRALLGAIHAANAG